MAWSPFIKLTDSLMHIKKFYPSADISIVSISLLLWKLPWLWASVPQKVVICFPWVWDCMVIGWLFINCFRSLQVILQGSCTNLYLSMVHASPPFPHSDQYLLPLALLITEFWTTVKWPLILTLTCIPWMINKPLFICLHSLFMSSLEKCLLRIFLLRET